MNTAVQTRLPPIPARVARLPRDARGYPIPWFVYWDENGNHDFRAIGPGKVQKAWQEGRCWVCGEKMGVHRAFVIGPMCAISRTTSEPPCHVDCAEFAAQACPFLSLPKTERNTRTPLPADASMPGVPILRNPGVAVVWHADPKKYHPFSDGKGGVLFHVGPPIKVVFLAQGRRATRAEVMESIESGCPALREAAEASGPDAVIELEKMTSDFMALVPAAA